MYTPPTQDIRRGPVWTTTGTLFGSRFRTFHGAVAPASTAWPVANTAFAIPFEISTPLPIAEIFFMAGTSPGTANYDLGIYNDAFQLIKSLGATAAVNTTDAILPVGGGTFALTLPRGRYFVAMSAAAITVTVRAAVNGNDFMRALGMFKMATAHPLPATFTPASMGTTAFMPTIGLATVTNIL